jgi:hypothetical protein
VGSKSHNRTTKISSKQNFMYLFQRTEILVPGNKRRPGAFGSE